MWATLFEVYECLKILRGEAEDAMLPTLELSVELTAHDAAAMQDRKYNR